MPRLFIGTSGYSYPHWQGVFYPEGLKQTKWLEYYAKFFNCVELNVTFYRLVQKKTFENWYKRTPKEFYFVAKGSKFITHIKKIKGIQEPLRLFVENVVGLKEKLSAILWQFPPSFKKELRHLEAFLKLLKKTKIQKIRQAFEFRNSSWFDKEVYRLFKEYNACLVIAHSSCFPYVKETTSDFIYLRFHGEDSLYSSDYSDKDLKEWAEFIKEFSAFGGSASGGKDKDIFAFFNNDASGYAIKNALRFKELLEKANL